MPPKSAACTSCAGFDEMQNKFDLILKRLDDISAIKSQVVELEKKVTGLEDSVQALHKEVRTLKDQGNFRDQQARSLNVRLSGFHAFCDTDLPKIVFNVIIKPVLAAACAASNLAVPSFSEAIDEIYRTRPPTRAILPPGASSVPASPPPIIIRFRDSAIRLAFLRNKRAHLPRPSAADLAAGTKRYSVVEDLTPASYKMLRALMASSEVDKVWSTSGRLNFTVPGNTTIWRAQSIFGSVNDVIQNAIH